MSGAGFPGPSIADLGRIVDALQQLNKLAGTAYQNSVAIKADLDDINSNTAAINTTLAGLVISSQNRAIGAWAAGIDPNNTTIFIAPVPLRVTAVVGRLEVPEGGVSLLSLLKVPSGTPIAGGNALVSVPFDANGTAATNQTLPLTLTPTDLLLDPGDAIGIVTGGAWTTTVGAITVLMVPV